MGILALADFGSTYTKLALVDRGSGRLLARSQAPTSVETDVMDGYAEALAAARAQIDGAGEIENEIAASSAGGGLRVVAIGLVDDLTAAAARQAALNAGARLGGVISGQLDPAAIGRLTRTCPDIVLFAGGTDGGQRELVLDNARSLAAAGLDAHVVVACNGAIAEQVLALLEDAGVRAVATENVMPTLGRIEVEGARRSILSIFLEHVIGGKGLSADPRFADMVRFPTPQAVLEATCLLGEGEADSGEADEAVMVVDIGGATTDVHSVRTPEAPTPGVRTPILQPPAVLRTVEGDLGLRSGAPSAVAADRSWLEAELGRGRAAALDDAVEARAQNPAWIPADEDESQLDGLLASGCIANAIDRHCGRTVLARARFGGEATLVREGPDLRRVRRVIGTGGVLSRREDGVEILARAMARRDPRSLAPEEAEVLVDGEYLMAAAGLFATVDPRAAGRLLRRELAGTAARLAVEPLGAVD